MNLPWQRPYSVAITLILTVLVAQGALKNMRRRVIRTHLGEPLTAYFKANPEPHPAERRHDAAPIIYPDFDLSEEVFGFVYDEPGAEIALPAARLIWINQVAGVVTEVTVNTSLAKSDAFAVLGELQELRKSLLAHGWSEVAPIASPDDVQAIVARSEGTTPNFGIGKYTKGNAAATIMMTSPGRVVTPGLANQRAFVAEIWIEDDVLIHAQYQKLEAARLAETGSKDQSLPLSYWYKP